MTSADLDGQAAAPDDRYRALLAVSEAIVSHRDLSALFHELASRLQQVVRFDYLALLLHEAESNTLRLHVVEPSGPTLPPPPRSLPVGETPPGLVWQTQQPLIVSNIADENRWPKFKEYARPFGIQSVCWLPLTTARRQLGTLSVGCKQPSAFEAKDVGFLQLVANQAAVSRWCCRPCGSAATTSRGWSAISPSNSPGGWAGGSKPSRQRSWTPSFATPGLALSAGCAACRRRPSSTDSRGSWG